MNHRHGLFFLVLALSLATTAVTHAGETLDLDAEAKQAAQEEADQKAERTQGVTGKYQRTFYGTFQRVPEATDQPRSPEVVGTYTTNAADRKPDRNYLVKVENGNKNLLEALKRVEGKKAEVTGKLRNINPEGEAKYLIVTAVIEAAPTPTTGERRKFGGL